MGAQRLGAGPTAWIVAMAMTCVVSCTGIPAELVPTPGSDGLSEPPFWRAAPQERLDSASAEALQRTLDDWLAAQDTPGATAAVITAEGQWGGAAGVDGTGTALQPDSAGAIASITKTFIAAELMMLAARGSVDLDDPVSTYVDLPFDDDGATIEQLLGMQSGFPQDPTDDIRREITDPDAEWSAQQILDRVITSTTQGELGGTTDYNNLNYWVLGILVEQVTGDRLAAVLRRDLVDPAGLDRVWFQTAEQPTPPLAIAAEVPDEPPVDDDGPFLPSRAMASAAGAAGGMAADAPTLARWGHLLYGGHVLDASQVEQMTRAEGPEDQYGLGTVLAEVGGERVVFHDGDIGVYHSVLTVWPSGVSVAVLVPARRPVTLTEERTVYGLSRALHAIVER